MVGVRNVNTRPPPEKLYPPTVQPPERALPLPRFIARFIRNPLQALPRAVYTEPVVTYGSKHPLVTWVTDPALIERFSSKTLSTFRRHRSTAAC